MVCLGGRNGRETEEVFERRKESVAEGWLKVAKERVVRVWESRLMSESVSVKKRSTEVGVFKSSARMVVV